MKSTVGVVGLGIMGNAIALNLKKAGFGVLATNRSPARRDAAMAAGLTIVQSPREVAEKSEAILVIVTDPAAVKSVLQGPDGVLAAATLQGKVLVQMSTIDEKSTLEIGAMVEEKGMAFLDCPVTGSKKQAEEAQLILLAGGDAGLIDHWSDLFGAIGKAVVHAGGIGKGTALKLCMNLIVAQMTTALCESVALAKVQALNPAKIFEVLGHSPALNCGYFKIKEKTLLEESYPPAFSLNNMLKDIRFMDQTAKSKRLNIPVTQAVKYLMEMAAADGHGDEDLTSVLSILKPASKV